MNFLIDNVKYKIKELKDINIKDYILFNKLKNSDIPIEVVNKELFKLFANVPTDVINEIDMEALAFDWGDLFKLDNLKIKDRYFGKELIVLDGIRFDKYITIDIAITKKTIIDLDKEIEVAVLLLLPNEYTPKRKEAMRNDVVEKLEIEDVLALYNYFMSWRASVVPVFKNLFNISKDVNDGWDDGHIVDQELKEEGATADWGDVVDMLAFNDILKIDSILEQPLLKVFNFLDRKIYNEKKKP